MTKTVNRGYIYVQPKQAFCDWAKQHDSDFDFNEEDDLEGSVYLIEEDFFEYEPILEANFKKILKSECEAVSDDEIELPKLTLEQFLEWYDVKIGSTVFDTLVKKDLLSESN